MPLSPAAGESGCCASAPLPGADPITADLYDASQTPFEDALAASLGCGNPTALAELTPGQDVLDLGSGGGLDVLLSARRVAPGGTAYGLDMTDEMLALARAHQKRAGVTNATFLKGHIEAIPLPDASVDVVISNCVINLSPDKDAVLAEAHRVLRPAGRFAVSDIVLLRDIPAELRQVVGLWTGCIAGALRDTEYVAKLGAAGFADAGVEITRRYERADLEAMAVSYTHLDVYKRQSQVAVVRKPAWAATSAAMIVSSGESPTIASRSPGGSGWRASTCATSIRCSMWSTRMTPACRNMASRTAAEAAAVFASMILAVSAPTTRDTPASPTPSATSRSSSPCLLYTSRCV